MTTEQAAAILTLGKVHNQGAPIHPEHAPDLLRAALPEWPRQVMKHQCAEHDVKLRVAKRECFGHCVVKRNLRPHPHGFRARPADHFG